MVPDCDGYVWIRQDKFQESFCQDPPADEALVLAVTQKAPAGSTFGDTTSGPAWKKKPSWLPGAEFGTKRPRSVGTEARRAIRGR